MGRARVALHGRRVEHRSPDVIVGRPPRHGRRRWSASPSRVLVLVGLALLGLAALTGALTSWALLLGLGLLALAVPSAAGLAARVLVAGTVGFALVPLTWWVPWPRALGSHAGVLTGLLAAILALHVTRGHVSPRDLVPRVQGSDLVWGAMVVVTGWMVLPGLQGVSGDVALSRMLHGWDHSAHLAIAEMLRTHGTVVPLMSDGPLGAWSYRWYPQGYHAMVATASEAVAGSGVITAQHAAALYARCSTLVGLLAVATACAGPCAVPVVRRRPALALPGALLVTAVLTIGRGGLIQLDGFPNFLTAVAMLATVPFIVARMSRYATPWFAALVGACVAVVHAWAPLLVLAAPAVLAVAVPWVSGRGPRGRREWVGAAGVAFVGALGMATAAYQLSHQAPLDQIVVIPGGISPVPTAQLRLCAFAAVVVCAVLFVRTQPWRRRPAAGSLHRTAALGAIPVVGMAVAYVIGRIQARTTGSGTYYLVKFEVAVLLVAVCVLVVGATTLLATIRPVPRTLGVPATALTSAFALVAFGWPGTVPAAAAAYGAVTGPGGVVRQVMRSDAAAPSADATTVLLAATAYLAHPTGGTILLPFPMATAIDQMMMAQWFDALTGTWTNQAMVVLSAGPRPVQDQSTAVAVAMVTLERAPGYVVMVGPGFYDSVRSAAAGRGWADRVTTW